MTTTRLYTASACAYFVIFSSGLSSVEMLCARDQRAPAPMMIASCPLYFLSLMNFFVPSEFTSIRNSCFVCVGVTRVASSHVQTVKKTISCDVQSCFQSSCVDSAVIIHPEAAVFAEPNCFLPLNLADGPNIGNLSKRVTFEIEKNYQLGGYVIFYTLGL